MNEISLIEKLKLVFDLTKSNIFYPIIILFLVFISILFITTNKNNAKESKKTYGALYAIAIIIILIKYESSLATMFDYMMNNLFIVFYFPNIAVYLGAIIITNIIMWISMFSTKTKQSIKIINSMIFSVIHYLFILILNIITTKNIDVFNQKSMYGNNDIHSLIELSSNIFLIWIVFLTIYKIIITYLNSKKVEKVYDSEVLTVEHIGAPEQKIAKVINLPNYAHETTAPYIVKREMSKTKIVYELPKQNENTAIYEQMLTLDDYKLLVSILKEQKAGNIKNLLSAQNKKVEEKHQDKPVIKEENISNMVNENKNENRLTELMEMYKSVN